MTTQTLEQTLEDFRRQCESFARKQQPRCGLIYELYQRRLSAEIDGYLAGVPAEYREELIAVARREFDYLTQDEIAGNDSNLLIVFYVQIMPDDFVMQLHRF